MGELEAAQQKHFRQVPQAQLVPQSAEHDLEDDVGRKFEIVEWSAGCDVVVCATDSFAETAVTGDLVLGMLKNRGAAAFVTDGFVRDVPGISAVGLPCYAGGVTPNSPARNGPGTVGFPVVVGGVAVSAGDVVLGDQDGVVIVPAALLTQVIERLPAIRAAEADLDAKVKAGLEVPGFLQSMIDAGRFTEVD
jgi:4-hydroxy-4-methyl-2-oxoglutarate aldolase